MRIRINNKLFQFLIPFRCLLTVMLAFGFALPASAQTSYDKYNNEKEIKDNKSVILKPGFYVPQGSVLRIFINQIPTETFVGKPSADQNYISTRIFRVPDVVDTNIDKIRTVAEVNQTIQYFDGLGRPLQTVQTQASPGFKDLVQPIAYDAFGRAAVKYLPYAAQTGVNGNYRSTGLTEVGSFYNNPTVGVKATAFPYSQTVFEASPLNRALEKSAPGEAWQLSKGHTVKVAYSTNLDDDVRLWTVTATGATGTTFYPGNVLYKTVSRDENTAATVKAGSIEEFKDLQGKVVLKRNWETESVSLSTYYIYDDFSNLRYVLPPGVNKNGTKELSSFEESQTEFKQYIYGYHYDSRNRIIEKKIPGKDGWEYLVYNDLDRLVLNQDANQVGKEWNFTKYDALGRVVITGIYHNAGTRESQQALVDAQSGNLWEITKSTGIGYTNDVFPKIGIDNNQVNYYDDYEFPGANSYAFTERSNQTRALLTGKMTRVLGSKDSLLNVNYYDKDARLIKVYSQHYLGGLVKLGNYDEITNVYSFPGELVSSTRIHHANGINTTVLIANVYDHQSRLLRVEENINNQVNNLVLSANTYNEIGQLQEKKLHDGLQTTGYTYNERGWLNSITSPEFSEKLQYEDGTVPQWNGNISNQSWGKGPVSGLIDNVFSYSYDKLNRLTSGSSKGIQMSEVLSYDVMGNILKLSRDNGVAGTYNYSGNQLLSVTGGPLATGEYTYDANGNATKDGRNGVAVVYNSLNLPQKVTKTDVNLSYVYDAAGNKLRKLNNTTGTTDYVKGIQYNNGVIEFIQTSEGVARNNQGGGYSYEYNLHDHLGNVRYSFNRNPNSGVLEKMQEDNYYPFGLRKLAKGGGNKYLYNGKELQEELGQYDYGARFYDPVIGKWNVTDALAENHYSVTPYNYVLNNPINTIDPFGLDTVPVNNVTPEVWHNFNTSGDNIALGEVSITATKGAAKAQAAYNAVQNEVQSNYRKRTGGLFMGYPDNLQSEVSAVFYERYIAHNEINPFTGQGRVVGLEDANWIIDIAVGGIYSLTRTSSVLAAEGVLSPGEIHFMQSSIRNATGEFTVLGNAEALRTGVLDPRVLTINVWKDASGKIWTLDHRRLAAFRLSGVQEVPIQWADPAGQMWKMTTTNGGTSIWLKLGKGEGLTVK